MQAVGYIYYPIYPHLGHLAPLREGHTMLTYMGSAQVVGIQIGGVPGSDPSPVLFPT